jgi:hypothetical protein
MRRAFRVTLGAAVLIGLALTAGGPAGATPVPASIGQPAAVNAEYGFAFADQPTTSSYTANPRMSANSAGGVNTVQRHDTGNYTVRMPGLGSADGGNVQLSAYGEHSSRCKASLWHATGIAMDIGVVCQNSAGQRSDTQFTVQFHRGSNNLSHQSAYLMFGAASITPDPTYSFNSTGAVNQVTRPATGRYQVDFGPGFTRLGGVVHVTGLGWDGDFCKVQRWDQAQAEVRCYTAAGQLTNSSWSLRYHDQHLPNGFAELGGYVWANDHDATLNQWYAPNTLHSFNMQGGEVNQVRRVAIGRYEVELRRIPAFDAGNSVATAHGLDGISCKVTDQFPSGSNTRVEVDCRNAAGALRNSYFTLTHVTDR